MAYDDSWVPNLDDDEDEEQDNEFNNYSDACIFLIESSESMLATPGEPGPGRTQPFLPSQTQADKKGKGKAKGKAESSVLMGLKAAFELMRKKIITSPKDHLGIIVYNTAHGSDTDGKWDSSVFVQDLVQIDAQHIKQLRLLIEKCEKDPSELYRRFKPRTDGPNGLEEALRACTNRFRSRSPKMSISRALILTDNDDPYPLAGDSSGEDLANFRRVSAQHVKDKQEMGVRFEQFFIERPEIGQKFDVRKFWKGLIDDARGDGNADDTLNEAPPHVKDVNELFQELIQTASTRESTKRALFSIPFRIAEGIEIGVQGYVLVTEEKRKAYVWFDPTTRGGEEVQVVTEFADLESTEKIPKTDIVRYYPIGDKKDTQKMRRVVFTPAEQEQARNLGRKPGLTLLGFKPREELPWHHHLKHAYFIHPNEEAYTGSNRTFAALLHAMSKKDKVGFGVFQPRKNSTPQLVAMLSQLESYDDDGAQETPSGLHLCVLPWTDDLRPSNVSSTLGIVEDGDDENEAIELAKKIVKQLKKAYQPNNYPNPALNHHYDCLAAIALKEDLPEAQDKTLPAYASIQDRCGKTIADFQAAVGKHPRANEMFGDAPKTSTKRRKVEEGEGVDQTVIIDHFKARTEKKLVVKQLKDFLIFRKALDKAARPAPPKAQLLEMTRNLLKKDGTIADGPDDSDSD